MEEFLKLLQHALDGELSTGIGRINLVFGVLVAGMVVLLYAGSAIEEIGEFVLRLFNKQGSQKAESDKTKAVISVIVFFVLSLVIVAYTSSVQSPLDISR